MQQDSLKGCGSGGPQKGRLTSHLLTPKHFLTFLLKLHNKGGMGSFHLRLWADCGLSSWGCNQVHHLTMKFNIFILIIYQVTGRMDHRVNLLGDSSKARSAGGT